MLRSQINSTTKGATYEEAKKAVKYRRIAQINKAIQDRKEEIQYWETKLANLTQE